MSNSIAPGSSADVNIKVTALTTNPNVPVTYKTIILKKNLVNGVNTLTQEMMSAQNTKYVFKYDYVLGDDITVPDNCILEFDGGNISGNHTITGTNTYINESLNAINNVILYGKFKNDCFHASTFGIIGEEWESETLPQTDKLQKFCNIVKDTNVVTLYLDICGSILIDDAITIYNGTRLLGVSEGEKNVYNYANGITVIRKNEHNQNSQKEDAYFVLPQGSRNIELARFRLVDTYNFSTTSLENTPTRQYGIYCNNSSRLNIHNINIYNVDTAFYFTGTWLSKFIKIAIVKFRVGIRTTDSSTTCEFNELMLEYCFGIGYLFYKNYYSTFINCAFDDAIKGRCWELVLCRGIVAIACGTESTTLENLAYLTESDMTFVGGIYYQTTTIPEGAEYETNYIGHFRLYKSFLTCVGTVFGNGENIPYPITVEQNLPDSIENQKEPNIQLINCRYRGTLEYGIQKNTKYKKVGNSSERPIDSVLSHGFKFFDQTLNHSIEWDGSKWVNEGTTTPACLLSGSSSNRPNVDAAGLMYFDTSIWKNIFMHTYENGVSIWKEYDGAAAGVKRKGSSAERPSRSEIYIGFMYFDTTLQKPIFWTDEESIGDNGWVDCSGNNPSQA